jgi:hypothetical protein
MAVGATDLRPKPRTEYEVAADTVIALIEGTSSRETLPPSLEWPRPSRFPSTSFVKYGGVGSTAGFPGHPETCGAGRARRGAPC